MKKRPQLERDELLQLKWLLGGVLALISIAALSYLDVGATALMVIGFVLVPLVLIRPDLPGRLPSWAHKLVFPAVLVLTTYDFYANGEPLSALVRLNAMLLLYRACTYRRRRDDLQLIVLGLFLIVAAGVITVSLAFAVQIVAFAACALMLLLLVTLVGGASTGKTAAAQSAVEPIPSWTRLEWRRLPRRLAQAGDWRVFVFSTVLFVGLVVVSGLLFLAIPRFQLDSGLFLDRLLSKKSTTGFSDTLNFTDVIDIQQENSVAARVEISDRAGLPQALYWRMVVMDEYRDRAFRMSPALRDAAFSRERTASRVEGDEPLMRGNPPYWTFYLEPGVGRYLPLIGGFRRLSFSEPVAYRASATLRLVMLTRDPVAMRAYRVTGMNTSGRLRDGAGRTVRLDTASQEEPKATPSMLELNLGAEDRATLTRIVQEITGGAKMPAQEFARAAMIWLARQHEYSLKTSLPSDRGDPLVRWLASKEPGHCELFAGAFTLLARAAGHPARVVAGFVGGTWNEDYLIIRNSNAHAWCEIADGTGYWLRMDPTNEGPRLLGGTNAGNVGAASLQRDSGWCEARLDRLRLLWYRRIVQFERGDQLDLVRSLKGKAETSGRWLRTWIEGNARTVRAWLVRPWDLHRAGELLGFAAIAALGGWAIWNGTRWASRLFRTARGRAFDPIRRDAGRWLRRLSLRKGLPDTAAVEAELMRLRYGRRESWPEPRLVFKRAKQLNRRRV